MTLRWQEEIELVKKEMANFLKFYADHILPSIEKRIHDLKDLAATLPCVDTDIEEGNEDVSDDPHAKISRYHTISYASNVLAGKLSLSQKGALFCKKQLREGVVAFKKVLAGDSSFVEVLEELELQEDDDEVSESSSDEDDDNDDHHSVPT